MKQVAIVTGGAKGIGRSCVESLVNDGFFVIFTYNTTTPITQPNTLAVKCDITLSADRDALIHIVTHYVKHQSFICLVNNAGMTAQRQAFDDINEVIIRSILETNLIGLMLLTKDIIKIIKSTNSAASIINITSQAAQFGGNNLTPYAVSKGGLNTFTIALAKENGPYGIRVNAVSPAIIATDMNSGVDSDIMRSIPLRRLGLASEVANVVVFLASERSSYITGAIIPVTGGR